MSTRDKIESEIIAFARCDIAKVRVEELGAWNTRTCISNISRVVPRADEN